MNSQQFNTIAHRHDWSEVYSLAETYQKQQQWQPAALAFKRAIELRPDFFWSYHHLGDVLTQLQQWRQASVAYSRAVKLNSGFFWSWHNLGNALTQLQQWQQASMAYSHAVEIDPNFFWSWHNLGDALATLQQWDKAIAIYLQAVRLQPEHQAVYQKIGVAFKQRGDLEESIQYYRQAIKSQQNRLYNNLRSKPEVLINLANTLVELHQTNAAIVLYYMVLELQPNLTSVLIKLAQLLQQQEQLQQDIALRQNSLQSELLDKPIINNKPEPIYIPGEIIIKADALVSADMLEELRSAVGWSRRLLNKVEQSLANSFCCVSAWHSDNEQQQLIGFARAVCDRSFHAVLLDIVVHPDFQNRGVGKKIVRALIARLEEANIENITLFASPHLTDFYHKLGFVAQPNNLQLMLWCGK